MQKPIQKPRSSHFKVFLNSCTLIICSGALLASCAPKATSSVQMASEKLSDSLGCVDVKSKMFDAFYLLLDQDQSIPSSTVLKKNINARLDEMVLKKQIANNIEQLLLLKMKLSDLVDAMLAESKNNPSLTWKEQVQKLIEYEMEDQSSVAIKSSVATINSIVQSIKKISQDLKVSCTSTADTDSK